MGEKLRANTRTYIRTYVLVVESRFDCMHMIVQSTGDTKAALLRIDDQL